MHSHWGAYCYTAAAVVAAGVTAAGVSAGCRLRYTCSTLSCIILHSVSVCFTYTHTGSAVQRKGIVLVGKLLAGKHNIWLCLMFDNST
jgi:hypothetical protein